MNKLGFAIKLASQGVSTPIECNKGQWSNKVVDVREYLKLFNGLQGTDNIVTFMSFDEGGCFLTQLRAISGRRGDFLSGWIYIPNTIEATGDEIMNAYKFVCNILNQSDLSEWKQQIDEFFSKEYPSKEYVAPYLPSHGDKFGVRFLDLGHYTMKEILDDNRYQTYYSTCKAVFLMDNKSGEVSITKEAAPNSFLDYTNHEIVKSAVLVPPSSESLQSLGKGTRVFTSSGAEFKVPMFVTIGSIQVIILNREGFENLKFEVPIQKDVQNLDVSILQVVWKKKISSSMFKVCNSKHEPIKNGVNITVNGQDITYKEISVLEGECRDAIVRVSALDFETSESRENLLRGEIPITLKRENKTYQSKIELANGKVAEITLKSKNLDPSHDSPLKGYNFNKDSRGDNYLRMSTGFIWKQRLYGFLAALVVWLFIAVSIAFDSLLDTHHFKLGLPPWEKDRVVIVDSTAQSETIETEGAVDSLSLENAIKYLDEIAVWDKKEMEKFPDLQGLYDDLNKFELSVIINKWSSKLSGSKKMLQIIDAAKKNSEKGWNPKQTKHNPTYNKEDDMQITVLNYINWLDQDQSKPDRSSSGIKVEKRKKSSTGSSAEKEERSQSGSTPTISQGLTEQGNRPKSKESK